MNRKLSATAFSAFIFLVLTGLTSCGSDKIHATDTFPGAEQDHNVRLVYWKPEGRRSERTYTPYVWRLKIPEEFVQQTSKGTRPNEAVINPQEPRKRSWASLSGRIDSETTALLPFDDDVRRESKQYVFHADIRGATRRTSFPEKSCIPTRARQLTRAPAYFQPDGCGFYSGGCSYGYEIDGWSFTLQVSRRLPLPAYAYCDPIRDWLNELTVYREPIPIEGRKPDPEADWKRYLAHDSNTGISPNPNAGPALYKWPLDVMYPDEPDYDAIAAELKRNYNIEAKE